jgi:hypothetical protein
LFVVKPASVNAVAVIARAIILRDILNPLILAAFIAILGGWRPTVLIVCPLRQSKVQLAKIRT